MKPMKLKMTAFGPYKECETIDPAAVKRANTFFPGTPAAPTPPADKASQVKPPASSAVASVESGPLPSARAPLAMNSPPAPPADDNELIASALNQGVSQAAALRKTPPAPANLWAILGVPWLVGAILVFAQWSVLRGRSR